VGGDVHGSRERVVGRLALVHVVVRVDRRLAPPRVARGLASAVRDHLAHVHVGLSSGARLPYDQREVIAQPAVQDLAANTPYEVGLLTVQSGQLGIDEGSRLLEHGEAVDHLDRHALTDYLEVLTRALGLGAPVAVRGHLDLAQRVLLYPVLHGSMLLAALVPPRPADRRVGQRPRLVGPACRPQEQRLDLAYWQSAWVHTSMYAQSRSSWTTSFIHSRPKSMK